MQKLYQKSEIWFAVIWIIIYVFSTSVADCVSATLQVEKSLTFALHLVLSLFILIWINKNDHFKKYGLCKTPFKPSRYLYYIPLALMCTVNFWFGVRMNIPVLETVFYVGSMICVGFLEEIIFRGFLFKAMAKDSIRSAMIVSSLTFGIGHFVNLFNGSGTSLVANLCQVCYAVAFGYLFVIIFHRGKSLLPCIFAHSTINAFSAFGNDTTMTDTVNIVVSAVLCVAAAAYALVLQKTLPREQ